MLRLKAVVLLSLTAAVFGQGKSGNVTVFGHVTIDGKRVPLKGDSIFPNEKLETSTISHAELNVDGATASIHRESAVVFQDRYLELECGRVSVRSNGFAVHAHDFVVSPLEPGKNTVFEVGQGANKLSIKAEQGKINIAHANTTSTLLPGQIRVMDDKADCKPLAAAIDWKPPVFWSAGIVPFYITWDDDDDSSDISPFKP